MSAAAAAPLSAATRPPLQQLLHRTLPSLRHSLTPTSRLAAIDVTPTHINLAISNPVRDTAFPFGLLTRTAKPSADARILASSFARAETFADPPHPLQVHALVVGLPPASEPGADAVVSYVDQLLREDSLLPALKGVLFFSEAHALASALKGHHDFVHALESIPPRLESRKLKRFDAAMNPKVPSDQLQTGFHVSARIAATEILQAVLDELTRQDRKL